MDRKYIMALDQGTTSSRAILFDKERKCSCNFSKRIHFSFTPRWMVEHNPMEIWGSQSGVMREVLETNSIRPEECLCNWNNKSKRNYNSWEKSNRKTSIQCYSMAM